MRPVERIDNFLRILGEKWKEVPDQRFTQFLFNKGIWDVERMYHYEETELLHYMFPDVELREIVYWTSFGKDGQGPKKVTLIKDLETDHLEAILATQKQIKQAFRELIEEEIKRR